MVHRPAENHHQPRKPQKSNKKTADISQKGEKEIFQELHTYGDVYLLNKPNMTPKDKENMEKSIKFLADYKMNTLENLQKLDAIIYTKDYIEIGGVKRARKNLQTEENGKDIFKHEDEVYFTFDALKKQKKLLDKQGMKIPGGDDFEKTLKALPGNFSESELSKRYVGANILGNILDLGMSGFCARDGLLRLKSLYGYVWSSSEGDCSYAWYLEFDKDNGGLSCDKRIHALPVRPIYK